MGRGPKARGSSRVRDQLILELHRVTGCGGSVIARELYNSGYGSDDDEPGDRDALKAITGGGRDCRASRGGRGSDALLIHYVDLAWSEGIDGGFALFYHPASQALQVRYRKPGTRYDRVTFLERSLREVLAKLPESVADDVRLIQVPGRRLGSLAHPMPGREIKEALGFAPQTRPYAPIAADELPGCDPGRLFVKLANNWNTVGWQGFDFDRSTPGRPHRPPSGRFGVVGTGKEMAKRLVSKPPKA